MNDWKTEWERRQPREIPPQLRPRRTRWWITGLVIVLLVLALAALYYIPITYGT